MESDVNVGEVIRNIRVAYGIVSQNAHASLYGSRGLRADKLSCCEVVRDCIGENTHPLFKSVKMENILGAMRTTLTLRSIHEHIEHRGLRAVNEVDRDAVYAQSLLDLIWLTCDMAFKLIMAVDMAANQATLEFVALVSGPPQDRRIIDEQLTVLKMLSRTTHCRDTEHQVGSLSHSNEPFTLKFAGMNANLAMLIWIAFSGTKEIIGSVSK